ncbi:MAG: interleukin-like EMT inducer domain-containing protein [Caldilineaceae bacterium]
MPNLHRVSSKRSASAQLHLLVLALYTILSLILTWPLVAQITTHVPGIAQWAFDESTFIWNIWYLKHALVDQLSNPLHTELIWYPLGIDLILYTYNFFHALVAQPLALAVNLAFGSNVALLSSTILSGYGTFLLVRYLLTRSGAGGVAALMGQGAENSAPLAPRPSPLAPRPSPLAPRPSPLAPFIAGLLYAFASNRAIYAALGHYDMVTTQWIPFYALMLLRSLDPQLTLGRRRKAAVLAGLFFAFTGLAEMISAVFLAIFTLIVVVVYVWTVFDGKEQQKIEDRRQKTEDRRQKIISGLWSLVSGLCITGAVGFLLWSPVLVPILYQFLTNDFSLKGWGEAIPLSTDLLGWFTPTVLHPLFGGDLVQNLRQVQLRALQPDGVGFQDVNTVFLGWVSLGLALIGAFVYRRKVQIWVWTCLVFGIFTLGPFLQINGRYHFDLDGVEATFPLPYALLHYIPIIKANRAPNRNSVVLMLGLAVLVGYGVAWLLQRTEDRGQRTEDSDRRWSPVSGLQSLMAVVLSGCLLFEHLAIPAPLSDARIPAVYAQIAADPRPVSVMQIPLGWRNSFTAWGPEQTQLQYFQSAHGKPMLGGNISRAPDFKLDYFQQIAYFQALIAVESGKPVDAALQKAAKGQAPALMALYNVGYVLLYPPIPQRFPYADTWEATQKFVKQTLPLEAKPFWKGDGIEAYRVKQPAGSDNFQLDLGVEGTYPYHGEGWDAAETDKPYAASAIWATDRTSRLFLPLRQVDPQAIYRVSAQVHPFAYPNSLAQTVQLRVNGKILDRQTLKDDWQTVTWSAPGSDLVNGLNRIELLWGQTASPRQVIPGSRQIGQTGVTLPIDAELKGFADGGFIALFDEQGKQLDASAGRHGVDVTVLDPRKGAIIEKRGFDTAANEFESQTLADFLAQVKSGNIVLAVSNGNATAFLTQAAVDGLRGVGADVTLERLHGQHFALIGVQGAAPGSAALTLDPKEAFLSLSLNRDRRTLAAAVDWVRVERNDK